MSFVALATHGADAATSTWTAGATGNWSNATDWTGGVPNSAGTVATYNTVTTAATTALDENITVGTISKQASGAWTITASGGTLTLDNTGASGDALIRNSSGSNLLTIGANIVIQNTDLDISSNAGVVINGNITAATAQNAQSG